MRRPGVPGRGARNGRDPRRAVAQECQRAAPCPDYIYRHRNLIERCWSRLKERRAIAIRYDKNAVSFAAGSAIAAALDWIKCLIR